MDLNQQARTRSRDWGEIRKDERIWEQAGPLRSAWLRVRQTNGNKKREREEGGGRVAGRGGRAQASAAVMLGLGGRRSLNGRCALSWDEDGRQCCRLLMLVVERSPALFNCRSRVR